MVMIFNFVGNTYLFVMAFRVASKIKQRNRDVEFKSLIHNENGGSSEDDEEYYRHHDHNNRNGNDFELDTSSDDDDLEACGSKREGRRRQGVNSVKVGC